MSSCRRHVGKYKFLLTLNRVLHSGDRRRSLRTDSCRQLYDGQSSFNAGLAQLSAVERAVVSVRYLAMKLGLGSALKWTYRRT